MQSKTYFSTLSNRERISIKTNSILVQDDGVGLLNTDVGQITKARVEGEVFHKVMNGEITHVELDTVPKVVCHSCHIYQRLSKCCFDVHSMTLKKEHFFRVIFTTEATFLLCTFNDLEKRTFF